MQLSALIGVVAATASTFSFAPQAWKIIKSRGTKDISTGMYVLTVGAFGSWTVYGVLLSEWPLIASNTICLFLSGFILAMKLLPGRERNRVADSLDPSK